MSMYSTIFNNILLTELEEKFLMLKNCMQICVLRNWVDIQV